MAEYTCDFALRSLKLTRCAISVDGWVIEMDAIRWCYGKTPMQTFRDNLALAKEKVLVSVMLR